MDRLIFVVICLFMIIKLWHLYVINSFDTKSSSAHVFLILSTFNGCRRPQKVNRQRAASDPKKIKKMGMKNQRKTERGKTPNETKWIGKVRKVRHLSKVSPNFPGGINRWSVRAFKNYGSLPEASDLPHKTDNKNKGDSKSLSGGEWSLKVGVDPNWCTYSLFSWLRKENLSVTAFTITKNKPHL